MDRTKRDLESVINSQKEQLARYEKRLKDVVTAYKGLLKEKEALETSLAAISSQKQVQPVNDECGPSKSLVSDPSTKSETDTSSTTDNENSEDKSNIQSQIATLMNSLATLSAEKSRMEASFQADKKLLRSQIQQKEQLISDLQAKLLESKERAKADVDEVKAKWIIERQEREKETNNQMLMIRELQKLYADERHLKENIEMQLNNFKTNFASNEAEHTRLNELQTQLKEAKAQLKQLQAEKGISDNAKGSPNSTTLLKQLQLEMQQLKEQHAVAIKNEQRRVQMAEDESRKQAILHEANLTNLETKLAELSKTVGNYDRLRQQDQEAINALKKQLQDLERATNENVTTFQKCAEKAIGISDSYNDTDLGHIVDEILRLKRIILTENSRSSNPMDLASIFSVSTDHSHCQEELIGTLHELDAAKCEIEQLKEKVEQQKSHVSTLQEKVKVLNRNIDEQELELKHYNEKLQLSVKEERDKWKSLQSDIENEYRIKLTELEQQLQKQRQRSLQLLDEKEQEIKALQTSFEIFHSSNNVGAQLLPNEAPVCASSDGESNEDVTTSSNIRKVSLKAKKLSVGESCHMLHYANEIARKDIEIANLRKAKYQAETAMRKAIHDKVVSQEELSNKIDALEEQVDRLERCQTREGANLEYLKNVVISYIVSKDADGKRHMMNAISAVLQFTPAEMQVINASLQKK
ncbi:GRIP and coiled-coil domain-containing protein 1 [Musca vetustissima]|uniref:GRIP and coiled-coil domain-containing protein 1 n=1 Tax=Musca vetustissima TaxID=27455 RepID=UPI002AB7F006|nr:GRIP and coiled-coil domain-containing protein 1 [Musca vetustissima]